MPSSSRAVAAAWSRWFARGAGALAALAAFLSPSSAPAQFPMRTTVIVDATVLVGDGSSLEGASIVVTGEKITAVGAGAKGGLLATRVPAAGKYVTPGLIDAWSTLATRGNDQARSPTARAADAFDRYARDEVDAALRNGVTMAFIPARALSGIGGVGSIVRYGAVSDENWIVRAEAAINAGLGQDRRLGALPRVKAAAEFRKQWLDARQYRKSLEIYEEDLKEYEERIAKRLAEGKDGKKEEVKDEKKDEPKEEDKPAEPPPPTPRPDRPRPPRPRPNQPPRGGERPSPRVDQPSAAPARDEKKDDLKKPTEPQKDRGKELLLRGIDGELVVRVEAHRPEDILNAIEVAEEFNLALMLEGASGGHRLADRLARARIPVVLSPGPPTMMFDPGPARDHVPGLAAKLANAGVTVCFGSGPAAAETATGRHLALLAAQAVGEGMDPGQALRAITGGAAELLGIAGDYGTVAVGRYADLVVWSDHPLSPSAVVERVYVHGKEVYRADASKPAEGDE